MWLFWLKIISPVTSLRLMAHFWDTLYIYYCLLARITANIQSFLALCRSFNGLKIRPRLTIDTINPLGSYCKIDITQLPDLQYKYWTIDGSNVHIFGWLLWTYEIISFHIQYWSNSFLKFCGLVAICITPLNYYIILITKLYLLILKNIHWTQKIIIG